MVVCVNWAQRLADQAVWCQEGDAAQFSSSSYLILSDLTLSYLTLPYLILCDLTLSYLTLPYLILSDLILSYLT